MDPMMELVNALNALTAALQKFSSQTTNAYLDTFEEIYDPEKDEPQAAEAAEAPKEPPTPEPEKQAVTFVQLRSRLSEISRLGFRRCVVPAHRGDEARAFPGLKLIPVRNISEAIAAVLARE